MHAFHLSLNYIIVMEIELVEDTLSPSKQSGSSRNRKFANDEAVLARFGKRQQLRVSASYDCLPSGPAGISLMILI